MWSEGEGDKPADVRHPKRLGIASAQARSAVGFAARVLDATGPPPNPASLALLRDKPSFILEEDLRRASSATTWTR